MKKKNSVFVRNRTKFEQTEGCVSINNVLLVEKLSDRVLEYINKTGILEDENIIAYYDKSIRSSVPSPTILTNKSVIYYEKKRVYKISLNQIRTITERNPYIYITPNEGKVMKIAFELFSGRGEFLKLLEEEANLDASKAKPIRLFDFDDKATNSLARKMIKIFFLGLVLVIFLELTGIGQNCEIKYLCKPP